MLLGNTFLYPKIFYNFLIRLQLKFKHAEEGLKISSTVAKRIRTQIRPDVHLNTY